MQTAFLNLIFAFAGIVSGVGATAGGLALRSRTENMRPLLAKLLIAGGCTLALFGIGFLTLAFTLIFGRSFGWF